MSELPFSLTIQPGKPAYEQVIDAVHRAIAVGRLKEGEKFPAVRTLSKEVGINPNTAHKVVQHLVGMGTLEVLPGRGTRVAERTKLSKKAMVEELGVEEIVIEAMRIGFSKAELSGALEDAWDHLKHRK